MFARRQSSQSRSRDAIVLNPADLEINHDNPQPAEVALALEVSDTSRFRLDQKSSLYARAGIQEYWVLDVTARRLIVHANSERKYTSIVAYDESGKLAPLAAPPPNSKSPTPSHHYAAHQSTIVRGEPKLPSLGVRSHMLNKLSHEVGRHRQRSRRRRRCEEAGMEGFLAKALSMADCRKRWRN
jgi:hypothetical protein